MSQQLPPQYSNQQWSSPQQPYQQPMQTLPQFDPRYQQPTQTPLQFDSRLAVPQPPQKPRKSRRWPWIVALIVVFFIGFGLGHADTSDTTTTQATTTQPDATAAAPQKTQPPAKPTRAPTWATTHTFTGNGTKKTDTFTVSDTWKLQWKCDPTQNVMGQYNLIASVTNNDGTPLDPAAVNTICKAGNTSGETTEHQGGTIYLDVNSEDNWTLTVQELK